jgi:VIT1/CCC1 family predicted Fe2+/Mn2+ transporter
MSFRDYLHEKAEESRHNETLAYLMFVAGAIFFVGGILTTLSLVGQPAWFFIIPYDTAPTSGTFLALTLVFSGFSLIVFGIGAGFNCSRDRGWYMQELAKANSVEEGLIGTNSAKSGRKKNEK